MKRSRLICLLPAVCLLCSCSRCLLLETEAEAALAAVMEPERKEACPEPKTTDTEALLRLLEGAEEMQPGTAGSSLRLAALAGGLLRWLGEYPEGAAEAKAAFSRWAGEQSAPALAKLRRTLELLRDCAQTAGTELIRGLLCDAGCSLPENGPSREEFRELLDGLIEAAWKENMQKIRRINEYFPLKSLQTEKKRVMIPENIR